MLLLLRSCVLLLLLLLCLVATVLGQPLARASDLYYTDITPVTDDSRYTTLNPQAQLRELDKVKHSKGNIVFTAGVRIAGDRLVVNHYDDESFPTSVDIEVLMSYPAGSSTGVTLTCIEIYVDTTASDAGGFLTRGGIGDTTAEILLSSNVTRSFVYETFFYGY